MTRTNISLTLTRTVFGAVLGLALAAPAFAQSSQGHSSPSQSSQGQSSQGQSSQGQQAQGSASQSGSSQQRSQAQVMSQDKLRQQLSQAGFREVKILDAAYLVQAKTQEGNSVLMMIDPPHGGLQSSSMQGGAPGSSTSGANASSTQSASGGSGQSR